MKKSLKNTIRRIGNSPLAPLFKLLYNLFAVIHYKVLSLMWKLRGHKLPSREDALAVVNNVTFIYKSFERQKMAKRLYKNIQKYYPTAKVIIADDSKKPLKIKGDCAEIIQLPFNSGLSLGLNSALRSVQTPFTMRMDDDILLTPFSKIHEQLCFLLNHSEIDLVAVQACNFPKKPMPQKEATRYAGFSMSEARLPLKIPHMTRIDETHFVMGKTPNIFLIRTEKYKQLGYDDNIRMIDHHEFFLRAAGVIVSSMDISAFVLHYHNGFDRYYNKYRSDFLGDRAYILKKHNLQ